MDQERIIYILEYLTRFTDEKHYVTIKDIKNHLAQVCNLRMVDDSTIRRDIDRLTSMGNNIVKRNHEHNTAYYALIGKGFSFNEIRFIAMSEPEHKNNAVGISSAAFSVIECYNTCSPLWSALS